MTVDDRSIDDVLAFIEGEEATRKQQQKVAMKATSVKSAKRQRQKMKKAAVKQDTNGNQINENDSPAMSEDVFRPINDDTELANMDDDDREVELFKRKMLEIECDKSRPCRRKVQLNVAAFMQAYGNGKS